MQDNEPEVVRSINARGCGRHCPVCGERNVDPALGACPSCGAALARAPAPAAPPASAGVTSAQKQHPIAAQPVSGAEVTPDSNGAPELEADHDAPPAPPAPPAPARAETGAWSDPEIEPENGSESANPGIEPENGSETTDLSMRRKREIEREIARRFDGPQVIAPQHLTPGGRGSTAGLTLPVIHRSVLHKWKADPDWRAKTCTAERGDGKRCTAYSRPKSPPPGFCFAHDPTISSRRHKGRQRGGATTTSHGRLLERGQTVPLETADDVRRFLGRVAIAFAQGKLSPTAARELRGLAADMLDMLHGGKRKDSPPDASETMPGPERGRDVLLEELHEHEKR